MKPTSDRDLNAILQDLVTSAQTILGPNFIGAYLQGPSALGNWDTHSNVDFLVVIDQLLSEAEVAALQEMHGRIYDRESPWAKRLEGSYFPKDLLRQEDSTSPPLYHLTNGSRELVLSGHDCESVARWSKHQYGITLAGPDPDSLVGQFPTGDLRKEVFSTMIEWWQEILTGKYPISNRWAQPFAVLSTCRILHTLDTGRITSRPAAAEWAQSALDSRWAGLIQRAWTDGLAPSQKVQQPADPDEIELTKEFIEYALDIAHRYR